MDLGVFIRHSFPKPDRKSCPTALCCFIKEGKVENRRPKPEATCLRMFTTRLKLADHATTPIKADPALGSCPRSKTFLKEWDKQSHGSAVPPQATGNYSSCIFWPSTTSSSLSVPTVQLQTIFLVCGRQKKVWPSSAKRAKTVKAEIWYQKSWQSLTSQAIGQ